MDVLNEIYYIENGKLLGYHGKSRKLVLPEGITKIGPSVFTGSNLEHIVIPSYVEEICEKAFENSKIESLYIAEGVKKIDENAFKNCLRLKEISIPSSIVPVFNSIQIFGEAPNVETIYIEKINSKILFFLEEKAFPKLKKIVLGFNNSDIYVTKLREKLSKNIKIVFEDDWRFSDDKEIDDLLESIRNKVKDIFPSYIYKRFKDELEKMLKDSIDNDDYEITSKVLVNKLQRIIVKFNDVKVLEDIVSKIEKISSIMDKDVLEVNKSIKNDLDKAHFIHYTALKYNDIERSKELDGILNNVCKDLIQAILYLKVDLSNYVFTEEKKLETEINRLYKETVKTYSDPKIGQYVDLINEVRGESKKEDSVFEIFNSYLKNYVKDELASRKRRKYTDNNFIDISKSFDRLSYYEKFIAGEIRSVIKGEITRYPDCVSLRFDLVKDFNNRDDVFSKFYDNYLIYEGLKPYSRLINALRKFKGKKEPFGYYYTYDEEIYSLLTNVELLTDSSESKEELDKIVKSYEDKLNDLVNSIPKDSKYFKVDKNLYGIQTYANEIGQELVSELSNIVEKVGSGVNKKSNTVSKVIDKAIKIMQGKGAGKSFLSRIEIKALSIMELLGQIKDSKDVEKFTNKIIESLSKCKDIESDQENVTLEELDKYKDLINDYISSTEKLNEIKNIINSKEAL
jgi:hypothetical protein